MVDDPCDRRGSFLKRTKLLNSVWKLLCIFFICWVINICRFFRSLWFIILNSYGRAQFNYGLSIWDLHKNKKGNSHNLMGCPYKAYVFWTDKLILSPGGQPSLGPHSYLSEKDMGPTFQC